MNELSQPRNVLHRHRGQGMTEYLLIVALVAIGSIAVVTIFGDNIKKLFTASNDALSGTTTVTTGVTKGTAATHKDIKNFGDNSGAGP